MARIGGNRAATTGPVVAAPGRRSPRGSVVGGCLAEQVEAQVRHRSGRAVAGGGAGATAPASRRCPGRARSAAPGAGPGWARRWRRARGRRRRRSARERAGALVTGRRRAEIGDEPLDEHPAGRGGAGSMRYGCQCSGSVVDGTHVNRRVLVRRVSTRAAVLSADRARSSPSARSSTAHMTLASSSTPSSTSSSSRPGDRCRRRSARRPAPSDPSRWCGTATTDRAPRRAGRRVVVAGRDREVPPRRRSRPSPARARERDDDTGARRHHAVAAPAPGTGPGW